MAPAEEPHSLFSSRYGAYVFKHDATPMWYIPRNPHPENDTFMLCLIVGKTMPDKNDMNTEWVPENNSCKNVTGV